MDNTAIGGVQVASQHSAAAGRLSAAAATAEVEGPGLPAWHAPSRTCVPVASVPWSRSCVSAVPSEPARVRYGLSPGLGCEEVERGGMRLPAPLHAAALPPNPPATSAVAGARHVSSPTSSERSAPR